MADYIDRETALAKLMQDGRSAKNVHAIMGIPAADVEPVRHGKWIPIGERKRFRLYGAFDVPQSETKMEYSCSTEGCWIQTIYRYPFCPGCGAKMDKEDGNGDVEDMGG